MEMEPCGTGGGGAFIWIVHVNINNKLIVNIVYKLLSISQDNEI